jgi:hypothetical protein
MATPPDESARNMLKETRAKDLMMVQTSILSI